MQNSHSRAQVNTHHVQGQRLAASVFACITLLANSGPYAASLCMPTLPLS